MTLDFLVHKFFERLSTSGYWDAVGDCKKLCFLVMPHDGSQRGFSLTRESVNIGAPQASRDTLIVQGTEAALISLLSGEKLAQELFLSDTIQLRGDIEYATPLWRVFDVVPSDFAEQTHQGH